MKRLLRIQRIRFHVACLMAVLGAGTRRSASQKTTGFSAISADVTQNIIETVAGTGTTGFSGDNGPAVQAKLYYPYDVAVSSLGETYVLDWNNLRVRKITADG